MKIATRTKRKAETERTLKERTNEKTLYFKLGRCNSDLQNLKLLLTDPLTGVGARRCYCIYLKNTSQNIYLSLRNSVGWIMDWSVSLIFENLRAQAPQDPNQSPKASLPFAAESFSYCPLSKLPPTQRSILLIAVLHPSGTAFLKQSQIPNPVILKFMMFTFHFINVSTQ